MTCPGIRRQLLTGAGLFTLPLAVAGLVWLFTGRGKRYRLLAWMFLLPLALFYFVKGRNYYQAPAYPMVLAAGAVWLEFGLTTVRDSRATFAKAMIWTALAANAVLGIITFLPLAPVHSALWSLADKISDDFVNWNGRNRCRL